MPQLGFKNCPSVTTFTSKIRDKPLNKAILKFPRNTTYLSMYGHGLNAILTTKTNGRSGEQNEEVVSSSLLFLVAMAVMLPTKSVLAETHYYNIHVKTSDRSDAGTDADVYVEVFGTNGSCKFSLDKPGYDDFERGDNDSYLVSSEQDLGSFYAVRVGHDDSGSGSGWHVASVTVSYGGTHEKRIKFDPIKAAQPGAWDEYKKSWIEPEVTLFDAGSSELSKFKADFDLN